MAASAYTGPVCYRDGWHWSISINEDGYEEPHERLYLEGDGSYRLAADGDVSWRDRTHGQFVHVEFEDGSPGIRVSAEDADRVRALLEGRGE